MDLEMQLTWSWSACLFLRSIPFERNPYYLRYIYKKLCKTSKLYTNSRLFTFNQNLSKSPGSLSFSLIYGNIGEYFSRIFRSKNLMLTSITNNNPNSQSKELMFVDSSHTSTVSAKTSKRGISVFQMALVGHDRLERLELKL